jgi:hypothetical protein
MGPAYLAMAGLSLYQGYQNAENMKLAAEYQRQMAGINAAFASMKADDAVRRGESAEQAYRGQVKKVIGSQRAAAAANGVDVNSGSAADAQVETAVIGEQEALKIRANAWKEAWGYKFEAQTASMNGQFAAMSSENEARNSLLTGGMHALDYGVKYDGYDNKKTVATRNYHAGVDKE